MSEIIMNENVVEMTQETKPVAKKLGRPAKIAQQMFVDMWNGSTNLNEVADTLGISKLSCSVRASNLRKAGVELNRFKRGRKKLKK
jgi:predicted transcriptional regulator